LPTAGTLGEMPHAAQRPTELTLGPFRALDALDMGLLTRNMLRGPAWQRLYRGIYADSRLPVDHRLRCQAAALLLPPGGAVGLLSAVHLWDVPVRDADDPVTVLVPPGITIQSQKHLVVRHVHVPSADLDAIFDVPVTSPTRTAFDVARMLPRTDAVIVLDSMFRRRKAFLAKVEAHLAAQAGWPGVVAARRTLSLSDGRAESPMETRLRLLLHDAGLPPPTPQLKIFRVKPDGRQKFVARVDLAYEDWKIAIEYDGDHHRDRVTYRFDMERQNELFLAGWTLLRFNADDVLRFPDKAVAVVLAALRRAGWKP